MPYCAFTQPGNLLSLATSFLFVFYLKYKPSGKWRENGVVIVWSSSLSVDIVETAPSEDIFVNKSGGGIKGLPMSRNKQQKMVKNGQKKLIFRQMAGKWGSNSLE